MYYSGQPSREWWNGIKCIFPMYSSTYKHILTLYGLQVDGAFKKELIQKYGSTSVSKRT